ncbi:MAG: Various polyols ABC transporter, permease component 1 [uncultured Rubrobacteraceae bacterium]|uniref:Various polyols ABC transporter, permease component 1 n=1 Tax=uncultured Rubrobacteraceae bacterium TaxID=349277 RepID=A0A6J4QZU2_9ACTN|nr:MAG: Various polyols ABC transporter, permease component 1 [uncultured Rubrobacteraceae bacterium]
MSTANPGGGKGGARRLVPSFEARMLLPALLLLAAISLFPFFYIIYMSFNEVSLIGGVDFEWVGLENWVEMFTDPNVRNSWITSGVYFIATVGLEMVLGIGIALLVHELVWGKNLVLSMLLLPMFVAPVIVGLLGRFLVDSTYGLYAWFLESTGLITWEILGSKTSALMAVILMDVWEWTPLITLIVLAGLSSMPQTVLEAAKVDGANYFQRLRHMVAPLISGVVVVALLIRSMDAIRYYDIISVTTNGGPADATKVIPIRLYETAFRFQELGYAAAIGLGMLAFSILVANLFMRILRGQERAR